MRQVYQTILVALGVFLLGCSPPPAAAPGSLSSASPNPMKTVSGQMLPISAQVQVANQAIQLEVAKTVEQQAMGLMYRTSLADDRGMLFPFSPARRVGFWMKHVSIPLDMVFLQKGRVELVASKVPPCQTDPCAVYGPSVPIDQVIELRGGRATELGIKAGDRLTVQMH